VTGPQTARASDIPVTRLSGNRLKQIISAAVEFLQLLRIEIANAQQLPQPTAGVGHQIKHRAIGQRLSRIDCVPNRRRLSVLCSSATIPLVNRARKRSHSAVPARSPKLPAVIEAIRAEKGVWNHFLRMRGYARRASSGPPSSKGCDPLSTCFRHAGPVPAVTPSAVRPASFNVQWRRGVRGGSRGNTSDQVLVGLRSKTSLVYLRLSLPENCFLPIPTITFAGVSAILRL